MSELVQAHLDHRRIWQDFQYAYPVISRRSKGVSLGVNLNPDKVCNFDCVYCEVDRTAPRPPLGRGPGPAGAGMAALLDLTVSGTLFATSPFDTARPDQRRLNDIAFSGDGEPTTAPEFPDAVDCVARLKRARGLDAVKLVLITDSTRLQAPEVVRGLEIMMANQGEIWAKLDAGTEAYYREINRSKVPFRAHPGQPGRHRQALAHHHPDPVPGVAGAGAPPREVDAYLDCLRGVLAAGPIQGIQLYTVARPTPEPEARALKAPAMDDLARRVRAGLPDIPVEVFYGPE